MLVQTDRSPQVLRNLQSLFDHGRLGGSGYVSILPVDQGIEHSAARELRAEPRLLRPREHREARDRGRLQRASPRPSACWARSSRTYAHQIPFIVKLNHNELLTYPNKFDQIEFASVDRAYDLGAAGVGATIYFGSDDAHREIIEIAQAFERAHELGHVHRAVVLPAQQRLQGRRQSTTTPSADLTGQANHLGVTIQADIIKQKLPENNGGYLALNGDGVSYGKTSKLVYEKLTTRQPDRPLPLPGRQLLHGPRRPHQLRRRVVRRDATSRRP